MFAQGEVWWAEVPPAIGSEPGWRRPAVVIQSDAFNQCGLETVVCAMVTSNTALARADGNVLLRSGTADLPRDSVVNGTQILTLDRSRLTDRIGRLPESLLDEILEGIALALGMI